MSAEFPALAEVVTATLTECGIDDADMVETPDIVRAWREACAIRTVEQLDALPDGAIVRAATGSPWYKSGRYNPAEPWWGSGSEVESDAGGIVLPALLIWHPEWAQS